MAKFLDTLGLAATTTGERLLANLPQVLEALGLLLLGWLLARLLRMATRRGAALLDTLLVRTTGQTRWRVGRFAGLLGTVVYWVVLLFFVTAATQALGLQTFTDWLARLLDHLPTAAAGLLIMVVGYLLSALWANWCRPRPPRSRRLSAWRWRGWPRGPPWCWRCSWARTRSA
jgi:hypothetical protein